MWMSVFWVTTVVLFSLADAQDCPEYSYLRQPPSRLSCNPFGSKLQLQCAANGPSSQTFSIHWYTQLFRQVEATTPSSLPTPVLSSSQGFSVKNVNQNGNDLGKQTTFSLLTKTRITEADISMCFWCELVITGYQPIASSMLCILDETAYSGVAGCSDSMVSEFNSTQICLGPKLLIEPTLNTPVEPHTTLHTATDVTSSHEDNGNGMSDDRPVQSDNSPAVSHTGSQTQDENKDADQVEAVYISVAMCAVFTVVIVVMLVAILLMCRQRPCTKGVFYSQKYMNSIQGGGQELRNAFSGSPDTEQSLSTQPLPLSPNTPAPSQLRRGLGQLPITASEPDLMRIKRYEVTDNPRHGVHESCGMLRKSHSLEDRDYESLSLQRPHVFAEHRLPHRADKNDYDHLESLSKEPKKEHYYYTLERSGDANDCAESNGNKLHVTTGLRPSKTQGRISPLSTKPTFPSRQYDRVLVQVDQDLFDDPKYAAPFKSKEKKITTPQVLSSPLAHKPKTRPHPHWRSTDNIDHARSPWTSVPHKSRLSALSHPNLSMMSTAQQDGIYYPSQHKRFH